MLVRIGGHVGQAGAATLLASNPRKRGRGHLTAGTGGIACKRERQKRDMRKRREREGERNSEREREGGS